MKADSSLRQRDIHLRRIRTLFTSLLNDPQGFDAHIHVQGLVITYSICWCLSNFIAVNIMGITFGYEMQPAENDCFLLQVKNHCSWFDLGSVGYSTIYGVWLLGANRRERWPWTTEFAINTAAATASGYIAAPSRSSSQAQSEIDTVVVSSTRPTYVKDKPSLPYDEASLETC